MAVLVRTNQSIVCCHRSDPNLNLESAKPTPDPDWFLADGQPPECTRFKVRPLNPDEFHSAQAQETSEARAVLVCSKALLSVDGEEPGDLGYGWAQEVTNLVVAVTTDPLAGRVQRWTDAKSKDTNDKAPPPASPST
jgi:hypothetical protein